MHTSDPKRLVRGSGTSNPFFGSNQLQAGPQRSVLAAISQTGEVHRDPGSEKIVL
jgi:hypothetical protein